jgi:hypothetical protein
MQLLPHSQGLSQTHHAVDNIYRNAPRYTQEGSRLQQFSSSSSGKVKSVILDYGGDDDHDDYYYYHYVDDVSTPVLRYI